KNFTFTCSVGTSSSPPGCAPSSCSNLFEAAARSRTAIPRWSIFEVVTIALLGRARPELLRAGLGQLLPIAELRALAVIPLFEPPPYLGVGLSHDAPPLGRRAGLVPHARRVPQSRRRHELGPATERVHAVGQA